MVDCILSMLQEGVEPYILPKKLLYFLNDAVTKNRTLSKASCQVRRLSKLSMSYIFVVICIFSGKTCSFICRCLPVLCTRVYFLSFVSAVITHCKWRNTITRKITYRKSVTCRDNDVWCPDGFRQRRINFVSAWRLDCPCQG